MRFLAILAAILLLAGCGGDSDKPSRDDGPPLDRQAAERSVLEHQRESTPGLNLDRATCPGADTPAAGDELRCTVDVLGVPVPWTVAVIGNQGDISATRVEQAQSFLVTGEVEDVLRKPVGSGATADCGTKAILLYEVGSVFPCRVRAKGSPPRAVGVVVKEPDGRFLVRLTEEAQRADLEGGSVAFRATRAGPPTAPRPTTACSSAAATSTSSPASRAHPASTSSSPAARRCSLPSSCARTPDVRAGLERSCIRIPAIAKRESVRWAKCRKDMAHLGRAGL